MVENGDRENVSSRVIGQVALVLGVSTDWLINGTGEPPTEDAVRAAVHAAKAAGSTGSEPASGAAE